MILEKKNLANFLSNIPLFHDQAKAEKITFECRLNKMLNILLNFQILKI